MSNLKDTDFDDLLRRASDEYPLRTDSTDWDRMAAALEKAPPPDDGEDVDDKRKRRRFLWLFLLLPLGGLGYYTWHGAGHSTMAASKTPAATTTAAATTASTTPVATTPSTGAATTPATPATTATGATASTGKATNPAGAASVPARAATATRASSAATGRPATGSGSATSSGFAATRTHGRRPADKNKPAGADRFLGANARTDDATTDASNNTTTTNARTVPDNTLSLSATNQTGQTGSDRLFYDLQRAAIANDYHLTVDVTAPARTKDSSAKQKTKTKTPHLYAGLIVAPDLSTVKMQSIKGVGTTFGLLLGYAFNKRWSVESGVYVDRKRYYTDGEYFNTKGVRFPPYAKLNSVDGTCYMWEIPLNVRYNFNPGAKTSWFATAGFSTYLMTHENYTYAYQWLNSPTVKDSTWNLKRPSQYPFSIINLSAGFEQRLGKIGNLRVEPYVRIPLTGMGTGKLPIMSAGVNIGITRQLWK